MDEFLFKAKLIERGWTNSLIVKFLPEPDQIKKNPRYYSSAPMKLYLKNRVEQIESTDQFKMDKDKSEIRKMAARRGVASKIVKTMDYVDREVNLEIEQISAEELIKYACMHYNNWNNDRVNFATKNSDTSFLHRICVNYLRHEMTNYDYHLYDVKGRVGIGSAYLEIRRRVFVVIAEMYPWLAEECVRQEG